MSTFKAWIETLPSGSFRVRHRNAAGDKHTDFCIEPYQEAKIDGKRLIGKSLAKALVKETERQFYNGLLGTLDLTTPLEGLIESYLASLEGSNYSIHTVNHNRNSLEPFLKENTLVTLADLSHEKIVRWRDTMAASGLKTKTIRGRLSDVRRFLNHLVEGGLLKESPFGKKVLPREKDPEPRFWTIPEWLVFKEVLAQRDRPLRVLCHLAHSAALRKDEALRVSWDDVQFFPDGTAELRLRKEVVKGKHNPRSVPLDQEVMAILGKPGSGFLVQATRHQIDHRFQEARQAAGLAIREPEIPSLTIHGLRHTFGKNFLQSGRTLRELQYMLGHQSIVTTQIYAQFEKSFYREGIDAAYRRRMAEEGKAQAFGVV